MPKPELQTRIIANEFPERTYSPTSFDLPLRKDVIQTQIPNSITRTFETRTDPRFPPKRAVSTVKGVLFHGTSSVDPRIIHGIDTNFIEKKVKKKNLKNKKSRKQFDLKSVSEASRDALHHAKSVYETSHAVLNNISTQLVPSSEMVLDAKVLNKREHPQIKLYENNKTLNNRIEELKRTSAGVRAAHTLRRLG